MTTRRKLAIAAWSAPREGNIYARLTLDATEALAYLDDVRARSGEKVTVTHLVGKAVAEALREEPTLNGTIKLGRYVPHDTVDVGFLVSMPDGSELARAKVAELDRKSVVDLARELREQAERLRSGRDEDWERSKGVVRALPTFLLRPLVWLTGFLGNSLGWSLPALGVEPFMFGAAIVTNVGTFGLDEAFVPPTPFARVPLYVLIGAVGDRPVAVGGEVVVRPQLTVTATIDHRFIDGFQGAVLARAFQRVFTDPWSLDRDPDDEAAAAALEARA